MTAANHVAETFIERMGLSAQAEGLPRIAGRMFGYFMIHGGPCNLGALAGALQVSRASVSTNARLLRDLGVLEIVTIPGDRQIYYRLTEQHSLRMLEGYIERMDAMRADLAAAQAGMPANWRGAHARLQEMYDFVDIAGENFQDIIDRLRARMQGESDDG